MWYWTIFVVGSLLLLWLINRQLSKKTYEMPLHIHEVVFRNRMKLLQEEPIGYDGIDGWIIEDMIYLCHKQWPYLYLVLFRVQLEGRIRDGFISYRITGLFSPHGRKQEQKRLEARLRELCE